MRATEARRPHAPARFIIRGQRRLVERGVGVTHAIAALAFVREQGRTRASRRIAASGQERIGHHLHELRHRAEGGLLTAGRSLARWLRQRVVQVGSGETEDADKSRRQCTAIVKEVVRRGDVLLVALQRGAYCRGCPEHRVEIEQHVIAGVAQGGDEAGRQAVRRERVEGGATEAQR